MACHVFLHGRKVSSWSGASSLVTGPTTWHWSPDQSPRSQERPPGHKTGPPQTRPALWSEGWLPGHKASTLATRPISCTQGRPTGHETDPWSRDKPPGHKTGPLVTRPALWSQGQPSGYKASQLVTKLASWSQGESSGPKAVPLVTRAAQTGTRPAMRNSGQKTLARQSHLSVVAKSLILRSLMRH